MTETSTKRSDEELAARCAEGIDAAERELLERYMQAIYWLPRQAFGADEDTLSDFLLYALEKLRTRDTLSKYDPSRGASFSTWFGVILRNLYLDYLRAQPDEPLALELQEGVAAPPVEETSDTEDRLLAAMHIRCRVLFKLLLCNSYLLTSEEVRWIADKSERGVLETTEQLAELEDELAQREANLQDRYDRLAVACWWKNTYEKQLERLEHNNDRPWTRQAEEMDKIQARLERRRQEYRRIVHDLSGTAGIATTPYKDLARILGMPEGTVASHISRCRAAAADFLRQEREKDERSGENE